MKDSLDDYYITRLKDDKKQKIPIYAKDVKCHDFGAAILKVIYGKIDLISIYVDFSENGFKVRFLGYYGEDHAREEVLYFDVDIDASGDQGELTV